jgi:NitT/TauT family transport system substrate-binding protein
MRSGWICWLALASMLAMACASDASRKATGMATPVPQMPIMGRETSAADAAPVHRVRVQAAYAVVDGMVGPLWLALDAGLWQRHGLDVELSLVSGTPNAMAALITDEVQFVQTAGDSALGFQAREPDVVGLLNPARASPHRLIVAPDIEYVEDLRGRRIGVFTIGDGGYVLMSKAFLKLGIEPERDVYWLPVGGGNRAGILAALAAGAIDAALLTPPADRAAIEQGGHALFSYADLGLPFAGLPVYTHRRMLDQQRPVVEAFIAGVVDGIRLFKSDPAQGKGVLARWTGLTDPDALDWTYEAFRGPRMSARPFFDLAQVQAIADSLAADQPELRQIQLSRVLDHSVLEALDRRGYLGVP